MRELGHMKKSLFYKSLRGKCFRTLIESQIDEKCGLTKGRTTNYVPVLLQADSSEINTLVNARIDTVDDDNTVYGSVCN